MAISGDESAVEFILHEVLKLLMEGIEADIGQINLLPKSGPVEKLFIINDKAPWLREGMGLHLFDPHGGFTGMVIKSGKSILVEDIWLKDFQGEPKGSRKNNFTFLHLSFSPSSADTSLSKASK